MSACNYTQQVSPNTCLGDSLATFNANFSALDEGLCSIPDVMAGPGIVANVELSDQNHSSIRISSKNSFVYGTTFDYKFNTIASNISLNDGTTTPVTTFPYVTADGTDPFVTFSTISLADKPPQVNLLWTAPGAYNSTVYATNSASSSVDKGPIWFNGPVTALLSSNGFVYVGGEFTQVGGTACNKFCVLDITSGVSHPSLGPVGSLVSIPLSANGNLGDTGTVCAIADYKNLIIVGGSYQSTLNGRGLTIFNRFTGQVYPFYVNGVVNNVLVVGSYLYVAGKFDFVNYTAFRASEISGQRVYTNGLMRIDLSIMPVSPNSSIDSNFATATKSLFNGPAVVNTIVTKSGTLYVGGLFDIGAGPYVTAKNLAIINHNGSQNTSWKPIVGGEVLTMGVDGDYLYVGGAFGFVSDTSKFFSTNSGRSVTETYNATCFQIASATNPTLESNWLPRFNGAVTKFAFHDSTLNSYVYCYGRFTQVNSTNVGYTAAITKSRSNNVAGSDVPWNVVLQSGPSLNNQGLIRYADSLIIGGSFRRVNDQPRFCLTRVSGVDEATSTVSISSVVWEFGSQLCSPGSNLSMDLTNFSSTSAYSGTYGAINQTTLTVDAGNFAGYSEGDLVKFFLRRPKNSGTLQSSVHVVGWKVDFNG